MLPEGLLPQMQSIGRGPLHLERATLLAAFFTDGVNFRTEMCPLQIAVVRTVKDCGNCWVRGRDNGVNEVQVWTLVGV